MEAIILAGGYGTRFLPITANKPKHMICLLGKPILEYVIDQLVKGGINDIIISTNRRFSAINHYFGDGSDFGCGIRYVIENERLGGGNAIKHAAIYSNLKEDFIVVLGDNILLVNYKRLINFHSKKKADVTLVFSKIKESREYGTAKISKSGRVIDFHEKSPELHKNEAYASAGVYIFKNEVLDLLDDEFYDSIGNIFPNLLKHKARIFGYKNNGYFLDVGNANSYFKAQETMLNKVRFVSNKAIISGKLEGNFWIGDNVVIEKDAVVNNSVINEGTFIETGSTVNGSTIFKSQIRSGSTVNRSFIDSYCEIDKYSDIEDSVLGETVYVGEGSLLKDAKIYPGLKILKKSIINEKEIKTHILR